MGWLDGKRREDVSAQILKAIPDKFKSKTPEEIAAMLEKSESLESEVNTLKTQRTADTEAVTQIQTQFEEVKARLQQAEANRNQNPNTQHRQQEEPADFMDEPDKAFNQRVAPIANIAVNNAAITAKILAQQELNNSDMANGSKDGRLFQAWDAEIMLEAKKYPTANLMNSQAWIGMFFLIKGRHADELANPDKRKKNYAFLEPSTTEVVRSNENGPKKDELSDEEKRVAAKMGVKEEDYLKRKKAMQFVNA